MFTYTTVPTPVLSQADFKRVFTFPLPLDKSGLLRAVELVLLPGFPFQIIKEDEEIIEISIPTYSSAKALFIDRRFLTGEPAKALPVPNMNTILDRLREMEGLPYIWGGNYSKGIPQLLSYYPSPHPLTTLEEAIWTLKGVDCSGMIYEATEGYTPRNTAEMFDFGDSIPLEGLSLREIQKKIRPLDLLLWKGHVSIALSDEETIESRMKQGSVFRTPLLERLEQIREETANSGGFVLKRKSTPWPS